MIIPAATGETRVTRRAAAEGRYAGGVGQAREGEDSRVNHLGDTSNPTTTFTFTSAAGGTVTGVAPGDSVDCTFTNKLKPSYLTLVKQVVNTTKGTAAAPTDWVLTATGTNATVSGVSGNAAVTTLQVPAGSYSLTEAGPVNFKQTGLSCTSNGGCRSQEIRHPSR